MDYLNLSDIEIWKQFKEGDEKAFSTIFFTYSGKLFKYGLKFTSNYSVVEDSIQEIFFELLKNRKSIGLTDNIFLYLLKSFRRKLFRLLKKENRFYTGDPEHDYRFEAQYTVEDELVQNEIFSQKAARLNFELKRLSPRQKEVIYLKYTMGFDYDQISEILEMSIESCRNLMYRAVKRLRDNLG